MLVFTHIHMHTRVHAHTRTHTHTILKCRFLLHSSYELLKDANDMSNFLPVSSYIFLTCISMEGQFQYILSIENSLYNSDLGFHAAFKEAYTINHEGFK